MRKQFELRAELRTDLRKFAAAIAAISSAGLMTACGGNSPTIDPTPAAAAPAAAGPGVNDSALAFDRAKYTTITVTLDGVSTPVRWYREVCYVGKPMRLAPTQQAGAVDNQTCGYQNMNIFVREADAAKQDNAILLNVNNGGWFASYQGGKGGWNGTDPITPANYSGADIVNGGTYLSTSDTDKRGAALKRGFVYINIASRSRGAIAPAGVFADGIYQGKSPAAIVDAKAAVRYLRLNDSLMPGSASRIVVNGTSGGGARKAHNSAPRATTLTTCPICKPPARRALTPTARVRSATASTPSWPTAPSKIWAVPTWLTNGCSMCWVHARRSRRTRRPG